MDFHRSTQARSWTFDERSLAECKQQAVATSAVENYAACCSPKKRTVKLSSSGVRKFASGFHHSNNVSSQTPLASSGEPESDISVVDQELLVQFHAHQIQALVGPAAILRELRTSETVLSTAITFFRRFYLSNSVCNTPAQAHPRNIAVACAYLAAKVEEEKIQIEVLSHASTIIQARVHQTPRCRNELRAVSVFEIEEAERQLMFGLDYMFRCYHTSSALQNLLPDFCAFRAGRNNADESATGKDERQLIGRALEVARRALIFSDAPFLYTPCHTAFAIASMVSRSITKEGKMGNDIQAFLVQAFPRKTKEELLTFARIVHEVIKFLTTCPKMDLRPTHGRAREIVADRADEFHRVMGLVAKIRSQSNHACRPSPERLLKRKRYEPDFTPPRQQLHSHKYVKVTPMARRPSVPS